MKTKAAAEKKIASIEKKIARMRKQIADAKTPEQRERLNTRLVEFICNGGK